MATGANATTTLSNWNFHTFHVQSELKGGQFVSAESTLIAAGPPEITGQINQDARQNQGLTGAKIDKMVFPMGVMENAGLSQSKQLQRIFEIGSARSYFVPGRVVGSISFGRVFYYGVSLLRAMYAHYTSTRFQIVPEGASRTGNSLGFKFSTPQGLNLPDISVIPGMDNFWFNLYSDIFNQPTGNMLYFRDMANRDVGALYLEYLYIQGHQLSISSGSVLLMEGTSGQFDRIVPCRMKIANTA